MTNHLDFNAWTLPERMRHAERSAELLARLGIGYDKKLSLCRLDQKPSEPAELIATAQQVAQIVAHEMRGLVCVLPPARRASSSPDQQLVQLFEKATEWVWISSDLRIVTGTSSCRFGRDLVQVDEDRRRIYRRLDLGWYGYLGRQMDRARGLHAAGRIDASTWDSTRAAFAIVWGWARRIYSADQLADAITSADCTYQPPTLPLALAS